MLTFYFEEEGVHVFTPSNYHHHIICPLMHLAISLSHSSIIVLLVTTRLAVLIFFSDLGFLFLCYCYCYCSLVEMWSFVTLLLTLSLLLLFFLLC